MRTTSSSLSTTSSDETFTAEDRRSDFTAKIAEARGLLTQQQHIHYDVEVETVMFQYIDQLAEALTPILTAENGLDSADTVGEINGQRIVVLTQLYALKRRLLGEKDAMKLAMSANANKFDPADDVLMPEAKNSEEQRQFKTIVQRAETPQAVAAAVISASKAILFDKNIGVPPSWLQFPFPENKRAMLDWHATNGYADKPFTKIDFDEIWRRGADLLKETMITSIHEFSYELDIGYNQAGKMLQYFYSQAGVDGRQWQIISHWLIIADWVLRYAGCGDEWVYQLVSKDVAAGGLWNPPPEAVFKHFCFHIGATYSHRKQESPLLEQWLARPFVGVIEKYEWPAKQEILERNKGFDRRNGDNDEFYVADIRQRRMIKAMTLYERKQFFVVRQTAYAEWLKQFKAAAPEAEVDFPKRHTELKGKFLGFPRYARKCMVDLAAKYADMIIGIGPKLGNWPQERTATAAASHSGAVQSAYWAPPTDIAAVFGEKASAQ